jgi:uncharacterized membrane protein YuzA (DUF378 family)
MNIIIFAKLLLIIGGITWGLYGALRINIIKRILPSSSAQNVIYLLVGLSALFLMFNRNFYLPFLDQAVLPKSFINKNKEPYNATFSVDIKVPPNSRVIYWASEPSDKKDQIVSVAYGDFQNSGITSANKNGVATLILRKPSSYVVKKALFKKHLKPHVHYRYTLANGIMSEVFTKFISKKDILNKPEISHKAHKAHKVHKAHKAHKAHILDNYITTAPSPSTPKSDLTHLTKCNCINRHLNIHDSKCTHKFHNKIVLESKPILFDNNDIQDYDKLPNKYQQLSDFNKNLINNTENSNLNNILKDRDLHSDININKFPPLLYDKSKVKFDQNYSNFN